ncbi:restriction endonuclease subunit S [Xanthomonas euvesicatoria]|uniref:restriction endonuclease subunit S n=1 Tax=Xanthomonas euvesicatoria TaxID=456327 RepID=UPI0009F22981|nr:restriction endonuclease subunit S [Xanthomonas euvesicatoria]MBV6860404.1 restriction endonuclease subunit S [Xanthomonas campestris pv. blepharidis]MDO7932238.1 restriction endonuclease subunit S [Xanthomonas euvesicatoria pv. eucalypti]MDO7938059.1 restriction endonuclease subunit S [Xanthomonas euvesicatoria pv. eucalypti]MDO7940606.1 restriction endonuclease subunit S [Xanthomonas euvesicatoria pv. eucalypti]MDO7950995.1 restriction endonuclease subunit S [Xanthomonas euvesicatoria pv.
MSEFDLVVDIPNAALWPLKSADSLCSLISRGTAPVYVEKSEVMAIGQRCVSARGFIAEHARPHSESAVSGVLCPESGDVLLNSTGTGTIGRSAVFDSPGKFIVDGHVTVMRPRRASADGRWLNSVLQTPHAQRHLERFCYAGSTNQLELSRTPLRLSQFPTPSLNEQEMIGSVVDTLDTAIHETEALIAKLKAVKQGLLHDLLTRGIDANGELRPPQSEAPCLYKPSTLGWIPKEWQDSLAEAEFHIDAGITLGSHRVPRRRPTKYLRVANVYRNRLAIEDVASLEASESEARLKALEVGDLLMVEGHASTSEIGRCAIADERVRGMVFQNHLFRLRCMRLLPEFGLLWLNSDYSQSYWRREAATSSGLNTINRTKLRCLGVALPPSAEQALIASRARAIATRIHCEARILGKLKTERSGLMNDLLTGRVRVTPLLDAATA